ncbi:MAG: helix-turn-helix transcriptional regulator [Clostridia bacterium]|nr:helix-turn-helix transcriptional regulator [Clostridia bacterium]
MYNNMKKIREIYGATQEEIAKIAGVNRSTVSQWETGALKASNAKLEKLSIFYGIGPECFYELEDIDEIRTQMLVDSATREREVIAKSAKTRNKVEEISKLLDNLPFNEARSRFMIAMKVMLATADNAKLEDLKLAFEITKKMSKRLDSIIRIKEEEIEQESTLNDLIIKCYEERKN